MSLRKISTRTFLFSAALSMLLPILTAEAQDVDVPGNLTMRDSTGPAVGNILKGAALFLHNFGADNTFLGKNAGNLTMTFPAGANTGIGSGALQSITLATATLPAGSLRSAATPPVISTLPSGWMRFL